MAPIWERQSKCYNQQTGRMETCTRFGGLPVGAFIGIVIGGILATALVIGLVVLLWRRKRNATPLGPDGLPLSYPRPKKSISASNASTVSLNHSYGPLYASPNIPLTVTVSPDSSPPASPYPPSRHEVPKDSIDV